MFLVLGIRSTGPVYRRFFFDGFSFGHAQLDLPTPGANFGPLLAAAFAAQPLTAPCVLSVRPGGSSFGSRGAAQPAGSLLVSFSFAMSVDDKVGMLSGEGFKQRPEANTHILKNITDSHLARRYRPRFAVDIDEREVRSWMLQPGEDDSGKDCFVVAAFR
jgi:hypothetical protein